MVHCKLCGLMIAGGHCGCTTGIKKEGKLAAVAGRQTEEGDIRCATLMYVLVAEMEAVKASIEGMKAENAACERLGFAATWNGHAFREAEQELKNIAERLRREI